MKLELECLACMLRQIVEAGRMSTDDETAIRKVMDKYALNLPAIDLGRTAPDVNREIQVLVKKELGVEDPYQDYKKKHIKLALDYYQIVKQLIEEAEDTITAAVMMAATGNSIDAGLSLAVDVAEIVQAGMEKGFYYDDMARFQSELAGAESLLIVADNSGETVFDKLLIEELNRKFDLEITYAVRSQPILNDVTLKEAEQIGIGEVCNLIESGCGAPGLLLEESSDEFKQVFTTVDIVISKGQGNYEGISETDRPAFYLLKAKCSVIAREFGVPEGALLFKYKD